MKPTLKTICKVHAHDYWDEVSKVAIIKPIYAMLTIESHSFGNQINYVVKWFKAHILALIGKHILTCLFLLKTMLPTNSVIVWHRSLKNDKKWTINDGFL